MKNAKKLLATILACIMVLTTLGTLPVFAADAEKVLFESDFNSMAEGGKLSGLSATENEERQAYARGAQVDGNGVLYIHRAEGNTADGQAGPRANFALDISKYTSLTIRFKAKTNGTKPSIGLYSKAAKKTTTFWSDEAKDWTDVVVEVNLSDMKYSTTVNGKAGKNGDIHEIEDPAGCTLRFGAGIPNPGEGAYFDDLKITAVEGESAGTGSGTTTETPADPAAEPAFVPATAAVLPQIPKDAHVFINTNFDDAAVTTKAFNTKIKGSKIFSGGTDFTQIVDAGGNRMMRYWATDGKQHGPRVEVQMNAGVTKQELVFAIMPVGQKSNVYVQYRADNQKLGTGISVATGKNGVKANEWNYLHLIVDTDKNVIDADINGVALEQSKIEVQNKDSFRLLLCGTINPNEVIYVDGIAHYTMQEVKIEGPLLGNQEIYWDNVKPSKELSSASFVNNVTAHPRLFVHNWDEMRDKIDDNYMTKQWYNNIKQQADGALTTKPVDRIVNSRGNVLESARSARNRIAPLAFMYKITGEKKYLDKAYEEMLAYGEWEDWSGFTSTLVTAEILQGYAYAYDWLHDDLTPEQRQAIIDIVHDKALPDFIYAYNGQISNTNFVTGTINWNPVCNATIIAWALASADETPLVSEYFLETVPPFIQNALPPYAPQGGYPEGVSYWDYGTSFLIFATDFLENAFVEGFKLPDNYIYWQAPGIADTADYGIYYDGPAGRFNYGDCTTGHTSCEVMYWAANRFNKPHYAWWQDNRQLGMNSFLTAYSAVASLAWYDADNAYNVPGAFPLDKFYTSPDGVNGGSMRSSWDESTALFGALQGGNNKANHQHLSLGTYVIDYMGKRFIRQLNSYDYALKDPKATIYYKRDESSNCLVINPSATASQISSAVARTIKSGTSDNTAFIVLDTTETYADYKSAKRGMMLTDNRSRIIVQDEVVANAPSEFYWFANTDASITIAKDGKSALLTIDDARMLARIIEGPAEAKFEIMDRKSLFESVTQIDANKGGQKLFIHLKDKTELNLSVEYVALKDGEGLPAASVYVPMESWSANDNGMTATALAGSNVVLKLGTPNAIANGQKTFVDTNNADVVPFTENGRTLVPVRFISEAFGARVGWQEATQTVLVNFEDKEIKLVIGSNEMTVNGETVLLDTPANTYNSRTLIPLRALVEALGKEVFWDDRGLIVIGENISYDEAQIVKLIAELDVRVKVNGKDVAFFELDRDAYAIDVKAGEALPTVEVLTHGAQTVSATQAATLGESAVVTVDGKNYTFKLQPYAFEGVLGHKDPGVILDVKLTLVGAGAPAYNTFIYVEDLTDSTGFATYPKRGIVDGVINTSTENRWAAQGEGWIQMDFGSVKNVHSMGFAGVTQTSRAYDFDVEVSTDGVNYTLVHTGGAQPTNDIMYLIPLGDVQARYVKITGKGNNTNAWNTYAEVRFYESAAQQAEDVYYWPAYFGSNGLSGKAGTTAAVKVEGVDAGKATFAIRPDSTVVYKVADESIATVAADGTISFIKAGTTTVTVTVTQDGYTASSTATITVE